MATKKHVRVKVNGRDGEAEIEPRLLLVHFIRDVLMLTGTHVETPNWETGKTCTPSPHHPFGAKGEGESPNVGSPAAFVNAVVDALSHLGVKHIDMPIAPWKIWKILKEKGIAE